MSVESWYLPSVLASTQFQFQWCFQLQSGSCKQNVPFTSHTRPETPRAKFGWLRTLILWLGSVCSCSCTVSTPATTLFVSVLSLHWCNLISLSGWTSLERPVPVTMVTERNTCLRNPDELFAQDCVWANTPGHIETAESVWEFPVNEPNLLVVA